MKDWTTLITTLGQQTKLNKPVKTIYKHTYSCSKSKPTGYTYNYKN